MFLPHTYLTRRVDFLHLQNHEGNLHRLHVVSYVNSGPERSLLWRRRGQYRTPVEWRIHWQIQYHPRANVKQWLEHDRYIFSTNQDTRSMAGEDSDAKQTEYRICVRKPVVEYTSWRRKEIWVQLWGNEKRPWKPTFGGSRCWAHRALEGLVLLKLTKRCSHISLQLQVMAYV